MTDDEKNNGPFEQRDEKDDREEKPSRRQPVVQSHSELKLYETRGLTLEACHARKFIEHFALVTAMPDGEDSSGRAKMGLMPVEQVVKRGCDLAACMMEEFAKRGWLHDSYTELLYTYPPGWPSLQSPGTPVPGPGLGAPGPGTPTPGTGPGWTGAEPEIT